MIVLHVFLSLYSLCPKKQHKQTFKVPFSTLVADEEGSDEDEGEEEGDIFGDFEDLEAGVKYSAAAGGDAVAAAAVKAIKQATVSLG